VIGAQANRVMYGKTLVELGERNSLLIVFEADIAKSTNTMQFAERFPERFFQVGVAEQNMMGIAAGAAATGLLPFVSTFAMFASMRACEQVRTSIAYPSLNVKIVATNAGVEIAGDGVTHQATEDLAVTRAIPNLVVVSPSDPVTTRLATMAIAAYEGPVYMRVGRQTSNVVHAEEVDFTLGRMIRLREGSDATIVATGNMVEQSMLAADELARRGIDVRVIDCHTIKPIDRAELVCAARETGGIVTAEDHNVVGGLGGAVCEVLAEEHPTVVLRVGLQDRFASSGRDYRKLLAHYHIDCATIIEKVLRIVEARASRYKTMSGQ
jgi:transketolase